MNPDGAEAYRPLASRLDESKGIAPMAAYAVRFGTSRRPGNLHPESSVWNTR